MKITSIRIRIPAPRKPVTLETLAGSPLKPVELETPAQSLRRRLGSSSTGELRRRLAEAHRRQR